MDLFLEVLTKLEHPFFEEDARHFFRRCVQHILRVYRENARLPRRHFSGEACALTCAYLYLVQNCKRYILLSELTAQYATYEIEQEVNLLLKFLQCDTDPDCYSYWEFLNWLFDLGLNYPQCQILRKCTNHLLSTDEFRASCIFGAMILAIEPLSRTHEHNILNLFEMKSAQTHRVWRAIKARDWLLQFRMMRIPHTIDFSHFVLHDL